MNLLGSQETWVLLCFAVAIWILPKVQLYIILSELRFCMSWWWGVAAGEGHAQEEDCADVVDQVQYGLLIAAGAPP